MKKSWFLSLVLVALSIFILVLLVSPPKDEERSHSGDARGIEPVSKESKTQLGATSASGSPSSAHASLQQAISQPKRLVGKRARLPIQADEEELAKQADEQAPAGVFRFARPIPVNYTPENSGEWLPGTNGTVVWSLEVESESASSLNFGFAKYMMPEGGSLRLLEEGQSESKYRSFTAADNEAHGQLWTPILAGDLITIEVSVPRERKDDLELVLSQVNHGFRGIQAPKSGDLEKVGNGASTSCQIDVVCDSVSYPSGGAVIEAYSSQSRAVGAVTLGGFDACSGAAINNTRNDNTPYFLTCAHVNINASNAPSMVVYWNFENSTCRPRNSANAIPGDGPTTDFSSGATFCSSSRHSDFCLVKLDDPIDPSYNVYFAGWDLTQSDPQSSVSIHHPAVAEKRISIDTDPASTTGRFSDQKQGNGNFVRVENWEHGASEPGSSGSPLFNENGHIVGQLLGGYSECGNSEPDWYGRISSSWEGEGTYWTRLSDWLDPDGVGVATLEGLDQTNVLTVSEAVVTEGDNGSASASFVVTLGRVNDEIVTVDWLSGHIDTDDSDFTPAADSLTFAPGETTKIVDVDIAGDTSEEIDETFFVAIGNPVLALLIDYYGVGTIRNDDFTTTPVITSASNEALSEGDLLYYQITADNTPESFSLSGEPAGMVVDANGIITWTATGAGNFSVQIEATSPAGTGTAILNVQVVPRSIGEAVDNDAYAYTDTGTHPMLHTSFISSNDGDSMRTPLLSDDESSGFQFTAEGPDYLVFDWRVSSEYGSDFFSVLVNGQYQKWIHGEVDWTEAIVELPAGANTVEFRYEKDSSDFGGYDDAHVDNIRLASSELRPFVTIFDRSEAVEGAPFSLQITTNTAATSITVEGLPAGLKFDSGNNWLSGIPEDHGIFEISVTAENGSGSSTQVAEINVAKRFFRSFLYSDSGLSWAVFDRTGWKMSDEIFPKPRSGEISHGGSSRMSTIVNGPGELTLRLEANSELNGDYVHIYINGQLEESLSGEDSQYFFLDLPDSLCWVDVVYAKNESVSSGDDAAYLLQTLKKLPPLPVEFTASEGLSNNVVLEWRRESFTDYYIYRATEDDTSQAIGLAAVTTDSYTDNTADPAGQYYYWVLAENQYGLSFVSNSEMGYRSGPLPAAPANLSAADSALSVIDVSWDSVTNATGYRVSRSSSDSGPWEELAELDVGTLSFTDDSNLISGVLYYYSVEAQNVMGYGTRGIDVGSLRGEAPTSLQISSENTGGATMQWTAPGYAVSSYTILRSETNDVSSAIQVGTVANGLLEYRDTSGEPATTYYYFVEATSDTGIQSFSSASASASTTSVRALEGGLMTVGDQRHLYIYVTNPLVEPPSLLFELSPDKVNWQPVDPADILSLGPGVAFDARHEKIGIRLVTPISQSEGMQYLKVTAQPQ